MAKKQSAPKQAPKLRVGKVSEFRPQAENANKHTPKGLGALRKAMQSSGYVAPVTATADREVIDGSARIETAFDTFADEAIILEHDGTRPIIAVRTDIKSAKSAKAKRIAIEANRIAQIDLDWDVDVLADMPADVLEGLFDADDLASMGLDAGAAASGADAEPQIDRAEELRAKWQTEPGQLWRIGEHRLLCGDSTRREDVERVMGGERAELLFTSPPYADMREYKGGDLSVEKLAQFITAFRPHVAYQVVNLGIKRDKGEVVEYWQTYIAAARSCGYKLLSWNVWDQGQNGAVGKLTAMFPIEHEWFFVFGEKPKDLIPTVPNKDAGNVDSHVYDRDKDGTTKKKGAIKIRPMRELGTIERVPPQLARNLDTSHPAMFPVRIVEDYANAMTTPGDIIAEPFAGSGTTIVACQQLGRKCRAIEISPAYVAVILERMKTAFPELKIEKVKV